MVISVYLEGYPSLRWQLASIVLLIIISHTLWCGQAATKAPEGTDRASFLVNAIDYVYSVKMVDSWEE